MPFELVPGSGVVTVLDGTSPRPLWVYVANQNAGSGCDVKWIDPSGPIEIKRIQLSANATGDPFGNAGGPWPFFVPAAVGLTLTNRNAGTAVYIQWEVLVTPGGPALGPG